MVAYQSLSSNNSRPAWLTETQSGLSLLVHVQPGAKKDSLCGEFNGRLKVSLCAPPVDGKANERLIRFLAKRLGISRACLTLVSGQTGRDKRLSLCAISYEAALGALAS